MRHPSSLALLLPFILVVTPVLAQTPPGLPTEATAKIESAIADAMARTKTPGLSAAVVADRWLVWSKGFGKADIENDVPATAQTIYRLASVSKTITAVAAMQLAERGKLDLDAPVQKYVPDFPEKQWPVTTRHLLGHLSGVRHYARNGQVQRNELQSTRHFTSLREGLEFFKDDPLQHSPGERHSYTTHGYTLLGCVVEGAAGVSFMEYVRENITKPAGMTTLRDDDIHAIIPRRAQGYRKTANGDLLNSTLVDSSYKIPGGGLCGSAEDLAKFAVAVQSDKLLAEKTRKEMFTPQKTTDGKPTAYSLGWGVGERNGRTVISHSGAQQRVATLLYMLPDDGFAVALMCNLEGAGLRPVAEKIADSVAPGK